ncbi:MAG: hypothetical protein ACOC56_02195 [Atribacterota bacterium]
MKFKKYLEERVGWENYPKGWSRKSVLKFARSLDRSAGKKGFFDACVAKIEGHLDNPEAFCASIKDEYFGSTMWRGKGKTEKEVRRDVAKDKRKKGK